MLDWLRWMMRRARRAAMAATKVDKEDEDVRVDAKRKPLSTRQFWRLMQRAVPARTVHITTRTQDRVAVPPEGGYLLQHFRALSGLLAAKYEQHAMNVARVLQETLFRQLGRKYTHGIMDLTLYNLSHGASRAAVEMNATAAGAVHYNSASSALTQAAKQQQAKIKKEILELPEDETHFNYDDNYYFRLTCAAAALRRAPRRTN